MPDLRTSQAPVTDHSFGPTTRNLSLIPLGVLEFSNRRTILTAINPSIRATFFVYPRCNFLMPHVKQMLHKISHQLVVNHIRASYIKNIKINMNVIDLTISSDSSEVSEGPCYAFEISGKPVAQPRLRFFRGGFFNPVKNMLLSIREEILQQIPSVRGGVLFGKKIPVTVELIFYLPRPDSHFKNCNRMPGNLKQSIVASPYAPAPIKPDIDNLIKFILDVMNKLIFYDDNQVVQVMARKLYDNEEYCNGRTVVEIHPF